MKQATFSFVILLVVALAAGCGGGGGSASLKDDDVAVVGSQHIPKTMFTALMDQACRSFKSQGRKCAKPGTTDYQTIKNQAMTLLVQQAEREEKAHDMGVKIDDKAVQKRLDQIKKQYFGGSEKKYLQQLKKQGLTDAQVRQDIRTQLISEQIFNKVTKDIKVSDSAVHDYYTQHPQLYTQPQSRDVRHILVKTKALADKIYAELKGGADFAKLAKKNSLDKSSAVNGGKLTISKGQTVPPFDKVAFSLKKNEISQPVHSQYGWHIIQALSGVRPPKKVAKKVTPLSQVKSSIKAQLLAEKQKTAYQAWSAQTTAEFAPEIHYAAGYTPPPATSTGTTGIITTAG